MYSDETSDESDQEIRGTKRWIPIDLPDDFDPKKVPTTGLEFLHHAMYEAKNCQKIVTADIDTSKFNQMCPVISMTDKCLETSKLLLPTPAWQKQKVEEFTEFRNYIQSKLPNLSEAEDPAQLHWIQKMEEEYPTFSTVSSFNAYTQLKLLELIIKQLHRMKSGSTISETMGVWIHSILCIIKIPMSPDLCSALRALARQCAWFRSKLPEDASAEMFTHLNFFICIIGIYFKQFDLADPQNS